jgi:hypothetical protein
LAVQDTLFNVLSLALAGSGVDRTDQDVPFHSSARVTV